MKNPPAVRRARSLHTSKHTTTLGHQDCRVLMSDFNIQIRIDYELYSFLPFTGAKHHPSSQQANTDKRTNSTVRLACLSECKSKSAWPLSTFTTRSPGLANSPVDVRPPGMQQGAASMLSRLSEAIGCSVWHGGHTIADMLVG